MKLKKELFNQINDLLLNEDALIDAVSKKLNIDVDRECSTLYDNIEETDTEVSYKDIVEAVKDVIINIIETYT